MQISGITRAEDSRSCNSLPEVERGGEAATGGLNPRHVFSFGVGNVSFYSMTSRLLMMLQVFVSPPQKLGAVPHGTRIIAPITSGTFEGPRLRGKVLPGGGDWTLSRSDSVLELDLRITLETDDGALISMTSFGLRHGPPEVLAALARGESVDPSKYYFRTAPRFETSAPSYAFLNRLIAIASGDRRATGPIYTINEIL